MTEWNLIHELRSIQSEFRDAELASACCWIPIVDGSIATIVFGLPILNRKDREPVVESGLPFHAQERLLLLFDRAGAALMHVPECGVIAEQWQRWIREQGTTADKRWAAFLTTGPRLMHVEEFHEGRDLRIQNVTRVCANAIDGLISAAMEAPTQRNTRNIQKKHSLSDDDNTLCLAEALDKGSKFASAAAFVRDFREKRPKCQATQKALEQMLSRQCDIWKKPR